MRIYHTTFDGWYITVNDKGDIKQYEGLALCPPRVKNLIKKDGARELDAFHDEAVMYGYVK